jgi:phytoene synthase
MTAFNAAAPPVTEAYEHCRQVVRKQARNFYFAFLSLPRRHRRAIYAVYAFCRECDDYADEPAPLLHKAALLKEQRRLLSACYGGRPEGPVFTALADVVRRYDIPEQLFQEIIDGVEMDLTTDRYATFEDLRLYCYRVASTVGLISVEVFGSSDPSAQECAVSTGIAMQLVNILRDLREDAARGRIYLPLEDLHRFGYPERDLQRGVMDARLTALMDFEAARAREYFQKGAGLLRLLPQEARACPAVLAALYSRLLNEMESSGWDVFRQRARLSTPRKAWVAASTWARVAIARP